ncbi:TPA: two-component-system connector protein AriR [Citrobacter freundii]|nr:two-component-system connector protein AriR [Citrobacter farmeri]HAT2284517.1 two-component-system connector protein AriR [Citrobacter freundii]ELR9636689.1 two-component-system connector protein AriR [Citrobacter farmeri]MBJ8746985.1 two-component-system connector protein AriR [Citrobacter farmeri]MBJ8760722.1 two-component-system connector protein AriR [Citrobacter farmeri]
MITAITQQPDIYSALPDHVLSDYFRHAGDALAEEAIVLGAAIRDILIKGQHINNKNIIISLVQTLEVTDDVVHSDVIRKTLEIVVGHTMDDI